MPSITRPLPCHNLCAIELRGGKRDNEVVIWKMAGKKRVYAPKKKGYYKGQKKAKQVEDIALALPRTLSALPNGIKTTMKYSMRTSLASVAGTPAVRVFSCNGVYDPDITGIGHQPRGFDQLMNLFDHFVVIGAKATVWFQPADTNTVGSVCFISVQDNNPAFTDSRDYFEAANVATRAISQNGDNAHCLVSTINPSKFLGRSKPMADPDLKGSTASNPNEQCFFHIGQVGIQDQNTTVYLQVELEYTVILIEPKVATIS